MDGWWGGEGGSIYFEISLAFISFCLAKGSAVHGIFVIFFSERDGLENLAGLVEGLGRLFLLFEFFFFFGDYRRAWRLREGYDVCVRACL